VNRRSAETHLELVSKTRQIAKEIAAPNASDVDAKSRFPVECFDALKRAKLLSTAVPAELGGDGCGMQSLWTMCSSLAEACGSSGMVLAMHHIQVACLARHGMESPALRGYLTEVVERQKLIASITSEVGTWGETRSSICAVERKDGRYRLEKDATTISYAEHADDLLATCRRAADAPNNDQVLVLLKKGEYSLTKTGTWDTLGMRGTCSPGFKVVAEGPEDQIVPGSFADSSSQSMVPYSHILWSGVWLGIAGDAVARAAAFVRAAARKNPGTVPATATRLADVSVMLQMARNNALTLAAEFDELDARPDGREVLNGMSWALKMNNLKVGTSEIAPQIVHRALEITGVVGYKNDSKFSVGRHFRDTLSAALMINNERITAKSAQMLTVLKDD
jgi:acyl-CoA dehydrogenase